MKSNRTYAALLIIAAFVLSACTSIAPVVSAQETARQADIQFVNHVMMGMAEQDVYVQTDDGMVRRITADEAGDYMDAPVFGTDTTVHHDPFGLDAELMQPFGQGAELGFSMSEWLAGTGQGTYTVSDDQTKLDLSFEKLVPNGVYTLWCSTISTPPNFHIVDIACGNPYGTENTMIADEDGNAQITMITTTMPDAAEGYMPLIALAYHSDGQTYGEYAGDFGVNSHVQIVAFIPTPDADAWRTVEAQ